MSCGSGKQEQPRLRQKASFIPKAPIKIGMTTEGGQWHTIPGVILIRTDTTLDQSQKAEKVRMSVVAPIETATPSKKIA